MRDDRSLPVTALHRFNYATPDKSDAQRKAVWASRNEQKAKKNGRRKKATKKRGTKKRR